VVSVLVSALVSVLISTAVSTAVSVLGRLRISVELLSTVLLADAFMLPLSIEVLSRTSCEAALLWFDEPEEERISERQSPDKKRPIK
jgi:hypothetical protein